MIRRTAANAPERALRPARRRSSLLFALGLVALSVFGGVVSPASATPPSGPPVLTFPGVAPYQALDSTPASIDVATPDSDTVIELNWIAVSGGVTQLDYCPGAATFSGTTTTCTGVTSLYPGIYDVYATSHLQGDTDPSGQSNVLSVEVYGNDTAEFLAPYPAASSSDATPTFTGDGPARGTVTVYEDLGGTLLCTTTVLNDGTWTCTANAALGLHENISLVGTDRAGGTSTDPDLDFTVTPIDDSTITGVDGYGSPWVTDRAAPDLAGTQDVNAATITMQVGQTITGPWLPYCQVTNAVGHTTWGCSEPDNGLQHGLNYIQVKSLNEHGDVSTNTLQYQVTLVNEPTITSPADNSFTNDVTPLFTGTGEGTDADVVDASSITQCSANTTSGSWSCSATPLSDGTYKFHVVVTPGSNINTPDLTFTVDTVAPTAPAITSGDTASSDRTPTISGIGEPFSTIQLRINGSPWPCAGGNPTVDGAGNWSCTLANALGVDSYPAVVQQTDRAGNISSTSGAITVTVLPTLALPVTIPAPAPAPTVTPLTWRLGSGLPDEVYPGDAVVLTASNLPPGLAVDAEFHSTVVSLGSTSVRDDGSFSLPVTVPADAPAGLHHFVVTVWTPAGQAVVVEQAVTVVLITKDLSPTSLDHQAVFGGGSGGTDRSDPGAPSSFTHGIRDAGSLLANPILLCLAALAAAALFLLVAFPAELLNSTISEQYARFSRRLPKAGWVQRLRSWLDGMPVVGGVVITLIAAFIFGFADPGFGFDVTSFRLVLSCAIALFVVGYLASVISGRILGGRWKLDTMVELKPLGLVLTIVGVVLSRLLDFSPGFLLGLILGLSLVGTTTMVDRARNTLVQAGVVFALAIAGWVLYSVLSGTMNPDEFGTALLFDTLVAITSEGLTAVFIGMLPVKFLDGPSVIDYSKKLWAVAFIVSAFAFVAIIVPEAWGDINGPLWLWAAVLGGFTVVAVLIYLYFRFWAPPLESDETEPEKELVETH